MSVSDRAPILEADSYADLPLFAVQLGSVSARRRSGRKLTFRSLAWVTKTETHSTATATLTFVRLALQVDVFSFGVVLWEILKYKPTIAAIPFQGA